MIIVYAQTLDRARNWSNKNIQAHDRLPVVASPETPNCFRGVRDCIIIVLGEFESSIEPQLVSRQNTFIYIKE